MPVVRTLISVPAGLAKMPAWQFFGFSLIGMVVWNTSLAGAGYLLDPHTATAIHVARERTTGATPMIVLGTAHPAKVPAAVAKASGITPSLPDWLAGLMEREEKFTALPSDLKMVEDYVSRHARAAR